MKFTQDQLVVIDDDVQGGELLRKRDTSLSSRFAEASKFEIITKGK